MQLAQVFRDNDPLESGLISNDMFTMMMQEDGVRQCFNVLSVTVEEAEMLFNNLADDDGDIDYAEFLQGVLKLKHGNRAMDAIEILQGSRLSRRKWSTSPRAWKRSTVCSSQVANGQQTSLRKRGTATISVQVGYRCRRCRRWTKMWTSPSWLRMP